MGGEGNIPSGDGQLMDHGLWQKKKADSANKRFHSTHMKKSAAELLKGVQLQGTQDFGTQSVRTKTSHKWAKEEGQDTKQRHLETI